MGTHDMPGRVVDNGGPEVTHSSRGDSGDRALGSSAHHRHSRRESKARWGVESWGREGALRHSGQGTLVRIWSWCKDVMEVKTELPRVSDRPYPSSKGTGCGRVGGLARCVCQVLASASRATWGPGTRAGFQWPCFSTCHPRLCPQPWDNLSGKSSSVERGLVTSGCTH